VAVVMSDPVIQAATADPARPAPSREAALWPLRPRHIAPQYRHCTGGGPDAIYASSQSGFINSSILLEFLKNMHKVYGPDQIIIVDGHKSRTHPSVLDWCEANRIHLFMLTPNATAILQMLDVAVFRPFKAALNKRLEELAVSNEPFLTRDNVVR
jgi:hypothetical protein